MQAAKSASDVCPTTGVALANGLKLIASPEISLKACLAEIHRLMRQYYRYATASVNPPQANGAEITHSPADSAALSICTGRIAEMQLCKAVMPERLGHR